MPTWRRIDAPVLVLHGTEDRILPFGRPQHDLRRGARDHNPRLIDAKTQ
jgi:hypothetical protein